VQKAAAPELPDYILSELPNLPRFADRKALATLITRFLYPVSPRSLEAWPLNLRIVNGHAVAEVSETLAYAWRKFDAAPVTMSGRKSPADAGRKTAA
jgi:hypothetical protein